MCQVNFEMKVDYFYIFLGANLDEPLDVIVYQFCTGLISLYNRNKYRVCNLAVSDSPY